jgi:phosphoglycerate dehydrogenase-like enzyme
MEVFLSDVSYDAHRSLLDDVAPDGTRWLLLHPDGSASRDGEPVELREAQPDVAWMTGDLIQGGPARQFFGLITRSTSLQWLQSSAAGFDHPMFAELVARGVRLTPSHIAGPPIADFVLRAALDHLQDADRWREAAAEHRWEPHEFVEAASTRWLVVGMGAIGAEIAVRARACGAHVTGVRRSPSGDEPVDEMIAPSALVAALPDADVVVLAVPSSPDTDGMVDATFLAAMRPGSALINIGRGALVDEVALLAALDAGRPSRAVLDVVRTEPLPHDDPLWDHPRVVLTPHSSALGDRRHPRAAEAFAANLARFARGEPLHHEVTAADLAS